MEELLFDLLRTISWPGAIALLGYFAYKSGIFSSFSRKMRPQESDRINELEKFKEDVEENHLHDLESLKDDLKELRNKVESINERLIRVETKIINGR